MLYFSSNMPGSIGGIDIWKVEVNSDGSFESPKILGVPLVMKVSFISDDNVLYFFPKRISWF
jgi:hypothetical protein